MNQIKQTTPFTDETYEIALKIIEKLLVRPTAYFFCTDIPCAFSTQDIRNLSLSTIRNSLESKRYSSIQEFESEIHLYFNTLISQHRTQPIEFVIIRDFVLDFERARVKRLIPLISADGWLKYALSLNHRIENLMRFTIPQCKPYFPYWVPDAEIPVSVSNEQLEWMIKVMPQIADPVTVLGVSQIIESDSPFIDLSQSQLTIDFKNLKKATINRLYGYLSSQVQKANSAHTVEQTHFL